MANRYQLAELRNGIDAVYQRLMRESEGAIVLNEAILDRIKSELRSEISFGQLALVEMALVKLVNDVSRRRGRASPEYSGPDLFGDFPGVPHGVSVGRGKKMMTADFTFGAAKDFLDSHPPKPARDPFKGFRQFVQDCEGIDASNEETLRSIMERMRKAH